MTALVLVCTVALLASLLTFYSGFGLGTLLLPAFALFFPVDQAVALTGVVHLLNGLFKLALVRRHVDRGVLWRFGLPAVAAALVGAWLLAGLAARPPLLAWTLGGREFVVVPVKLAIGGLLIVFAALELSARFRALAFAPHWIPLGGALSGFFGGLAGMQGALRAAFLVRAGLGKEAFIATGAAIAVLIDVSRLGVYAGAMWRELSLAQLPLLVAATLSAFAGAWLGNRHLHKLTMAQVQRLVAALLFAVGAALAAGVL